MKMKDMVAGLKAMEAMLSSWSASTQASKDINRIVDLMSRNEELSVAQFCTKVEKALDAHEGNSTAASPVKDTNKAHADAYIERIKSPELTRAQLTEIVNHLKSDKTCRLRELDYIANAMTQSGRKYRSKKDAIQEIERFGHRRLDVGRRMEDTSGVF
jgi:hypothetical protein